MDWSFHRFWRLRYLMKSSFHAIFPHVRKRKKTTGSRETSELATWPWSSSSSSQAGKTPRHMGSNGVKSYQMKLFKLPKFYLPNFDFAICLKHTLVRFSVFFCTNLYLLLLAKHRFVIRLAPALANWIVHPAQKAHRVVQARYTVVLEEILHQVIGATSGLKQTENIREVVLLRYHIPMKLLGHGGWLRP